MNGDARSKIHAYERGKREPSFKKILALEVIFGMSAGEIFASAYEDVESAVMARAAKLHEKLEHASDPKSRRKVALLRNMMRRAKPTGA
jgi:transcriptional regulator with XRE-family HTH domain